MDSDNIRRALKLYIPRISINLEMTFAFFGYDQRSSDAPEHACVVSIFLCLKGKIPSGSLRSSLSCTEPPSLPLFQ